MWGVFEAAMTRAGRIAALVVAVALAGLAGASVARADAEATGPSGAVVSYGAASASDLVDGAVAATCAPTSGSTFPLGSTTVTCTATDSAGNAGTATTTVLVHDTTPPVVKPPKSITVVAP